MHKPKQTPGPEQNKPQQQSHNLEQVEKQRQTGVINLSRSLSGAADDPDSLLQIQANRLSDARFLTAQRQTMAVQLGRMAGNRYFQRVIQRKQDEAARTSNAPAGFGRGAGVIQTNYSQSGGGRGTAAPDSGIGDTIIRGASARRIIVAIPESGGRYQLLPPNPNHRTLYFFYGYDASSRTDQIARATEAPYIADDIVAAAARGFTVVYDEAGTLVEFANALYDPNCYGIYWSGHGMMTREGRLTGGIATSDGHFFGASSVDPARVSPNIRFLILAACGSGVTAREWQSVLPAQCRFEGWEELTSDREAIDFTDTALVGDSWIEHGGLHPDRELPDYIDYAAERD